MIEESYVSFDTAKMLKEAGFDVPCRKQSNSLKVRIMTKEQIEQAANAKYADNTFAYKGFIDGAKWRINSVWHSTDELPKYSGFLATLMDNGLMETLYYSVGIGFHEMNLKGYVLWAYVSDLLPKRKETDSLNIERGGIND